jgi:5,10-methylene-tetrahydrofolate dehydrogenase/methenyl tetrahydrofolate cyclohydrolase
LIAVSVAIAMMIVMPVRLAWGGMTLAMLLAAVVRLYRLQRRCCNEAGDR